MLQIKKPKLPPSLRWLLLLPIPLVWCIASHLGWLTFLENKSVDWRFQFRGEIDSPVKLVYVDIDSLSLSEIGGQPWTRSWYSRVSKALIDEGGAREVGIDIVLSDAGLSESVDPRKHIEGNIELGQYLAGPPGTGRFPPVALAAAYGGWQFLDLLGEKKERQLPLVETDHRNIKDMEAPEVPVLNLSAVPGKQQLYTPPNIGLIDTIANGTRWVPAWAPNNLGRTYYHMALELARLYWRLPPGSIQFQDDVIVFKRPDGFIQATVPLVDKQLLEINWFTSWYSPYTSHAEFSTVATYALALQSDNPQEVKAGKAYFAQNEFKDAVVLIGPVDPLLQDRAPTSLDEVPVPRVSVHGNLLKTIVGGEYLRRPSSRTNDFVVFALTIVVATLSVAGGARALFAKIMAVLAIAIYTLLAFQMFKGTHIVLPFTAPLGSAFTTSFAGLIWQVVEELRAKNRIKNMFGTYVSPALVHRMVESDEPPQLGGHDAEITAYFSDIQSFSTFSEKLKSGPLVELMNEYLTACTDIVTAHGGTLDKYIGDAVVAMFGAPIPLADHAFRACVATQKVHAKLGELREKWQAEGDRWPEIVWKMQSRIGLNSGVCMIGNMGSRTRFNYTMMGDNVNLAARMESGAKSWGAYTMCAEATRASCEKHGPGVVVFRPLGQIVVKGRTTAVPIFEIVGLAENVTPQTRECIGIFGQAMERYYARDWDAALKLFAQSRELEFNVPGKTPGVVSNPSLVYLDITAHYKHEPPPENWDGVYHMKEK